MQLKVKRLTETARLPEEASDDEFLEWFTK